MSLLKRGARIVLGIGCLFGSAGLLLTGLPRPASARMYESALTYEEEVAHCPDVWLPWMGPGPIIVHRAIRFVVTSAHKTSQDSTVWTPDGQRSVAWYDFSPDPSPSESKLLGPSPENNYPKYMLFWVNPQALMTCHWYGNNFHLLERKTKGETFEVNAEDECDDYNVPGCEGEGGSPAVDPNTYQNGAPLGGAPNGVPIVCDVYYQYDVNTGEILYWTVLSCYPAY
jgi:hypothetical protein